MAPTISPSGDIIKIIDPLDVERYVVVPFYEGEVASWI